MQREGNDMRRRLKVAVTVGVLVVVILIGGGVFTADADDGRRIVTFQGIDLTTTQGYKTALGVVTASGSTLVFQLSFVNALAINLPLANITGAVALLLSSPYVLGISDDPFGTVDQVTPTLAPVVEDYDWGLKRSTVPEAHRHWPNVTGEGVKVAILDTGIDSNHPDLYKRVGGGYNALPGGGSTQDDHGHGTFMAGIIGARDNNVGIIGISYHFPLRIVHSSRSR
jgi:subtilisin family serine protease